MGRPSDEEEGQERVRGTLQIIKIIKKYGINAAIGINNVGNAFTPQGSLDPLSLASLGVGIYQAATKADMDLLLVSHDRFLRCTLLTGNSGMRIDPCKENYRSRTGDIRWTGLTSWRFCGFCEHKGLYRLVSITQEYAGNNL